MKKRINMTDILSAISCTLGILIFLCAAFTLRAYLKEIKWSINAILVLASIYVVLGCMMVHVGLLLKKDSKLSNRQFAGYCKLVGIQLRAGVELKRALLNSKCALPPRFQWFTEYLHNQMYNLGIPIEKVFREVGFPDFVVDVVGRESSESTTRAFTNLAEVLANIEEQLPAFSISIPERAAVKKIVISDKQKAST